MQYQEHAPADPKERGTLAERIHHRKNELYAAIVAEGRLPLRDGVRELLEDCARAGVRSGIVTTTSRANVEVLLSTHLGRGWESGFATVICAREAPKKKPHPQAYRLALEALRLQPDQAVAIEDASAGVAAAHAAGVPVIVTRSHYFAAAATKAVLASGPSLGRIEDWHPAADAHASRIGRASRIGLDQIIRWHAQSCRAPRTV
jgi:HAD superfamily hydrolase (TIGR01509 family)